MTEKISALLWGPFTIGAVLIIGTYLTFSSRFIQFRFAHELGGSGKNRLKAVSSALAASMGTGNITGCAAAIAAGGAGAVFWMWVSAFFGMALAYTENKLGAEYKAKYKNRTGSPMLYIEKGMFGRGLAVVYAFFCLLSAFFMGCMSQSGAFVQAASDQTGLPPVLWGIILGILTAAVIFSSSSASSAVMGAAEKAVPVMSLFYAAGCIALVIINKASITGELAEIVHCAFTPSAAAGGAVGISVKTAVSVGLRRGVFSNEAGMGSSVLVHSEADFGSPESVGAWAAFEVFLDTMVCCTLTALAVMSSCAYKEGRTLVITNIFTEGMGRTGGIFICISVCLFAIASLLGWCIYGEKCVMYLNGGKKAGNIYRLLYAASAVFGAFIPMESCLALADIFTFAVMLPNLLAVCAAVIFRKRG